MCSGSCRPLAGSGLLEHSWLAVSSNVKPRQKAAPSSRYCGSMKSVSLSAAALATLHASSPRPVR